MGFYFCPDNTGGHSLDVLCDEMHGTVVLKTGRQLGHRGMGICRTKSQGRGHVPKTFIAEVRYTQRASERAVLPFLRA